MLQLLRMIVRKTPLLSAILLIWILTAILALAGRGRGYRNYSTKHGMLPGVSVIMRGIHDHIAPWSEVTADRDGEESLAGAGQGQEDGENPEAGQPEEGTQAAAGNAEADGKAQAQESPEQKAADDALADGTAAEDGTKEGGADSKEISEGEKEQSPADQKTEEQKTQEQKAAEQKTEEQKTAEQKTEEQKTADGPAETAVAKGDAAKEGAAVKDGADADGKPASRLRIPETSCSKVTDAKDYGIADAQYLSPAGTTYNTDTEGLFAPDGVFYSFQTVEDTYFSDALFIGDSRTVGLLDYGGIESLTSFLARESTTVYDLLNADEKMDYTPKGKKTTERTMKDLLSKAVFKKIYLSVGVNELGIPDTLDYYEEYRKVLEAVHKLQPEAVIYIQGIMHVSREKSRKDPVFNNKAIVERNRAISTLANGRNIFYIDMNEELCDKNGDLMQELTGDGIHLKASACSLWYKFLKEHAIVLPD